MSIATAHVNIALIKYWGKADEELIIPRTSSLSLTLDDLYTTTSVEFVGLDRDEIHLDGQILTGHQRKRVEKILDTLRGNRGGARVVSTNTVPTAAGLASSASGFAALAGAATAAVGLHLTDRELSRLARRGSGSASRSIFGGTVLWNAGYDDLSSYAEPVATDLDLAIVVLMVDTKRKAVSSTEAMRRTVATSDKYAAWVEQSALDLEQALAALREADIEKLGEVTEKNALGMHETMWSAQPPIHYFTPVTKLAFNAVQRLRSSGMPVWATMDAGPNVKVLTPADQAAAVAASLGKELGLETIIARPGPGIRITDEK